VGNEQLYEQVCNTLKNFYVEKEKLYKKICERLKLFYLKKEKMRLRGFNDFNFINLLKGFKDETTHSKIIAEFLNPQGSHYQKELFLEKFFKVLNFESENLKEWEIYTEFFVENIIDKGQGRIDIFFKNEKENKFIILENKIWASDQSSQIYKYVEALYKKFKIKNFDDILVLYLTPFKRDISSYSLDNYYIKENYLVDSTTKNKKAIFKNITYENEILNWLEKSLKEVENISNLREALKQYQKAVKNITNKEEDVMSLKEYLKNEKNKDILIILIENKEDFFNFIKNKEECKKIVEDENLDKVINEIIDEINFDLLKEIKKTFKENLLIGDNNSKYLKFLKIKNKDKEIEIKWPYNFCSKYSFKELALEVLKKGKDFVIKEHYRKLLK